MSKAEPPKATIIIPSYNHARWVVGAVRSALGQTVGDVEVIVIDDGSSDDSVEHLGRLADPRLTLWTQENQGLSRTLNRGLAAARARWVKFLPSDDMLEPRCIERQLEAVAADPDSAAIFCLPLVVDADDVALRDPAPQAWFDSPARSRAEILTGLIERNFLCAPGALFARDRACAVGGFDPSLRVAQDYDLWLKLLARGRAYLVPERVVRVRWHGANQSYEMTEATEAERAACVLRALEAMGLDAWTDEFRAARGGDRAQARLALAESLLRSGIPATRPFVGELLSASNDAGFRAPDGAPRWRERLRARVRGLVASGSRAARRDRVRTRTQGAPNRGDTEPVAAGPRAAEWLILAALPMEAPGSFRSAALAFALARRGQRVWYAARFARGEVAGVPVAGRDLGLVELGWDLGTLRARIAASRDRLCLLLEVPEGEVVALAREASAFGARVVFDKSEVWERRSGASWHHPADEQAAVDLADDLIAAAKELARSLAAARRPVHYLPNAIDRDLFAPRARPARDDQGDPTWAAAGGGPSNVTMDVRTLLIATSLPEARLDWETVRALAVTRPSWKIVVAAAAPSDLPRNVIVRGAATQRALAEDLGGADALWLPLARSPRNRALAAPEVLAALALRRPVIAPPLAELADAPFVFRAEGAEATIASLEEASTAPVPVAELEDFVARHTWESRAGSLELIVARPTVAVIVVSTGAAQAASLDACLDALLRFRDAGGYTVAVVEHGSSAAHLEALRGREEAGEIRLVGSPLASATAARNTGLRATRSELVAFVEPTQLVCAPGWLRPAMDILVAERDVAAVGAKAGWIAGDASVAATVDDLPARGRASAYGDPPRRDDVAFVSAAGLLAPRSVLVRAGGFDEAFASSPLADVDLSFRLRALGYAIVYSPDMEIEHDQGGAEAHADDHAGKALLLERWRSRREYFRAAPLV